MHYVANRKMTKTWDECNTYCRTLRDAIAQRSRESEDILFLAVPFVYLQWCQDFFGEISCVEIMAQDCAGAQMGRATGQVHPSMISSLDVRRVMIGHSETRSAATERESNDIIRAKLHAAHDTGCNILYCCGETTNHQTQTDAQAAVIAQIDDELGSLVTRPRHDDQTVMIGYEPCWAIGSNVPVPLDHIRSMIGSIHHHYPQLSCLYGGSVDEHNISDLSVTPHLDGVLLGRAGQDISRLCATMDMDS